MVNVKNGRLVWVALLLYPVSLSMADDLPNPAKVRPVELFTLVHSCGGLVFDHEGNGYISHGREILKFSLDGKYDTWAELPFPRGHKILADGTHLVCDSNVVLHMAADGKMLKAASEECAGKKLSAPYDIALDTLHGGFYFSDPGGSSTEFPIGTVHYVGRDGKTTKVDEGLAAPLGIVLTADGRKLYLAESQTNRVHIYDVKAAGKLGTRRVFAVLAGTQDGAPEIVNQTHGLCLDTAGNLYVAQSGTKQVQVLDPTGKVVARYDSGNVAIISVAFGGPKLDQLFTAGGLARPSGDGGVFRIDLGVKGLPILPSKQ